MADQAPSIGAEGRDRAPDTVDRMTIDFMRVMPAASIIRRAKVIRIAPNNMSDRAGMVVDMNIDEVSKLATRPQNTIAVIQATIGSIHIANSWA